MKTNQQKTYEYEDVIELDDVEENKEMYDNEYEQNDTFTSANFVTIVSNVIFMYDENASV